MWSVRATQTVPPTEDPITLADLKRYRVIEDNLDDPLWLDMIAQATKHFETVTNRPLMAATWEVKFPKFEDCMQFSLSPFRSLAIEYIDADGNPQTLATTVYEVISDDDTPRVVRADGQTWPTTKATHDAVTFTVEVGYAAAADVPEDIKRALCKLIGLDQENREGIAFAQVTELPHAIQRTVDAYRRPSM